jgi:basic membrane protein A
VSRTVRPPAFVVAFLAPFAAAAIVAGCGFFSNPPEPTSAPPSVSSPTPAPTPTPVPTAAPTNLVATIVLIAAIGESTDGTPSKVAWQGVQDAAGRLGAGSKLVVPTSMAELTAAVKTATTDGTTIVVTVGPNAAQAVLDNATGHAATQFFELDQTIPDGSPANVHGLVFDEAEAGYLAGVVAASLSATRKIGLVGVDKADIRTANYAGGLANGATYANPAVVVTVAYATRSDDPQMGRAAAAGLVTGKADAIVAMADLAGAGAMREACARKASVVALDTDASLVLPDVAPCVVVSVLKRYDVAAREAILRYAARKPLPAGILFDVAGGGIGLSEFHQPVPQELTDRIAGVLAAMRNGPPRPTPTPESTPEASPTA